MASILAQSGKAPRREADTGTLQGGLSVLGMVGGTIAGERQRDEEFEGLFWELENKEI